MGWTWRPMWIRWIHMLRLRDRWARRRRKVRIRIHRIIIRPSSTVGWSKPTRYRWRMREQRSISLRIGIPWWRRMGRIIPLLLRIVKLCWRWRGRRRRWRRRISCRIFIVSRMTISTWRREMQIDEEDSHDLYRDRNDSMVEDKHCANTKRTSSFLSLRSFRSLTDSYDWFE